MQLAAAQGRQWRIPLPSAIGVERHALGHDSKRSIIGRRRRPIKPDWYVEQEEGRHVGVDEWHAGYLRYLKDSELMRKASITCLQTWLEGFYPGRPHIVAELRELAKELGGQPEEPRLRWEYGDATDCWATKLQKKCRCRK